MLFTEKESYLSDYIKKFEVVASEASEIPKLSLLRVELKRVHPGMTDYILRVATPKYQGAKKTGTVLSIRGGKELSKYDDVKVLASTICLEMKRRDDATTAWKETDVEHLTDMLYPTVKYFTINTRVEVLRFTTEALA